MCFNLPQRMINIAKLACVISVVSVAFSSCLQKDVYDPANSGDKEEVTLDNYFDFATTKNIQLNIDYGKECPRAYFEVYAENPLSYVAEGGQIIKKAGVSHIATGFTDIQGRYIKPASFPTAVSEVYIYSPDEVYEQLQQSATFRFRVIDGAPRLTFHDNQVVNYCR